MLKSGRISPYFFNAGLFNTGRDLAFWGRVYAAALVDLGVPFDLLFGSAYKGIPIATTTVVALAAQHQRDVPYCFNRKEAKDHGESGTLVGSPLQGKVMLVDGVITAGIAIRDSMAIIAAQQATLAGVMISLDRQEKGCCEISAIQEVEHDYHYKVLAIITLADLRLSGRKRRNDRPSRRGLRLSAAVRYLSRTWCDGRSAFNAGSEALTLTGSGASLSTTPLSGDAPPKAANAARTPAWAGI